MKSDIVTYDDLIEIGKLQPESWPDIVRNCGLFMSFMAYLLTL